MSYLREYIRHYLFERETYAFGEFPLTYNPKLVLSECNALKEGFDIVSEDMELAYFSKNHINEINGAAWIKDLDNKFEFSVITDEQAQDFVFENLVRNCMNEYFDIKTSNPNLRLEIKVEDEETENHLSEMYGLSVLRREGDISIMGFEE